MVSNGVHPRKQSVRKHIQSGSRKASPFGESRSIGIKQSKNYCVSTFTELIMCEGYRKSLLIALENNKVSRSLAGYFPNMLCSIFGIALTMGQISVAVR